MYTYLIVDDEFIERKGIRMLLSRMNIKERILEASNGEEALEIMKQEKIDVLLTDINMPFMDGIELLAKMQKIKAGGVKSIIFSGYDEFSYAKKAIYYGVSAYILKPVDPDEFEKVLHKIIQKLDEEQLEEKKKDESIGFFKEHLLYLMVNGQSKSNPEERTQNLFDTEFVKEYRRMILLECSHPYFEQLDRYQIDAMKKDLDLDFQYLNLNPQQSLLFFVKEPKNGWETYGKLVFQYIRKKWNQECFLAVSSEITPERELYDAFAETEQLMEQRFYDTDNHIFLPFQEAKTESLVQTDTELLTRQIQQDIRMKDIESLKEHFDQFCKKYEKQTLYSQIYIKFMFSNLLKEIYDHLEMEDERELDKKIDALYHSTEMTGVIHEVRTGIEKLQSVLQNAEGGSKRKEVEKIKQYIRKNYSDNGLGVDQIAREIGMTPNYLSSIFKKDTGENLSRYLKNYRMEKAKELLENTYEKIGHICQKCGFSNVSYFCQSFREYYGISPQKYRDQGE